jgi:hippurate hydrolase
LHKIPELALEEYQTSAFVQKELSASGIVCRVIGTAVIADIPGLDKTLIALRADMDGLPVSEKGDLPYRSAHVGRMHACGHDGHMAMLLGAAAMAAEQKPAHSLRLIFQPAEENLGGAERLIAAGVLDGVDRIYGLHVSPDYDKGVIATAGGGIMAGVADYRVEFFGSGAHCAVRDTGTDALAAACMFYEKAEALYRRVYFGRGMHHIGKLEGGTAANIVASYAYVNGTFRFFQAEERPEYFARLHGVLEFVRRKTGAAYNLVPSSGYPPLVNDSEIAAELLASGAVEAKRQYTAEDFAFYLKRVRGAFCWVGIRDESHRSGLHSETFDFDETALLTGTEFYKRIIF